MKVRLKDNPEAKGGSSEFNTHGLGEVIVGWDDDPDGTPNGMDSVFIRDLEVFVVALGKWKDMRQAFKSRDLIPDNYNACFSEPPTPDDRKRGYTL